MGRVATKTCRITKSGNENCLICELKIGLKIYMLISKVGKFWADIWEEADVYRN